MALLADEREDCRVTLEQCFAWLLRTLYHIVLSQFPSQAMNPLPF